jgi:hypothetical protein
VDVDVPPDPSDTELVNIHLPERVDVPALEPSERLGLANDPHHEAVALEDPMDGAGADRDPSPTKEGVDAQGAPGGVLTSEGEDPVDEIPMGPIGAMEGTPGLVSKPTDTFLSVVSAPAPKSPTGDPEDPADLRRTNAPLEVLLDGLQSKANIFSDQSCPFPGRPYVLTIQAARCPLHYI